MTHRSLHGERDRVCAVVVSYQPDAGLLDNIESVRSQVGAVYLVDNASGGTAADVVRRAAARGGVTLEANHTNRGVATALNQGMHWAREQGFRWVLTLDQDSTCAGDMVNALLSAFETSSDGRPIAMVGARHDGIQTLDPAVPSDGAVDEVPAVITSGSLIPMAVYDDLGPFQDELFIDWVDVEYCLRARAHGYRVLRTRRSLMEHAIGAESFHRLAWRRLSTTNHSALRRYYRHRNVVHLLREYARSQPGWAASAVSDVLKGLALLALFEQDRAEKLGAALRGLLHGARGVGGAFDGSRQGPTG